MKSYKNHIFKALTYLLGTLLIISLLVELRINHGLDTYSLTTFIIAVMFIVSMFAHGYRDKNNE